MKNENGDESYQSSCDAAKAVLRGRFVVKTLRMRKRAQVRAPSHTPKCSERKDRALR